MSNLIRLSDVHRQAVVWLEHGTIPRGMPSILAGHPGLGKSLYGIQLAARLSKLGFATVICSAEDTLEYAIKPRLQAAGANTNYVHALVPEDADRNPRGVSFPTDAAMLLEAIREVDAVLAIIDPITAQLDAKVDSHKDASLRSALAPLHRIAEETLAAVLIVFHLNKTAGSNPMMRLGGSIGGPGAARSCLLLDRDPDDPDKDRGNRRVLAHFKSNVGKLQPSRLLKVEEVLLPADNLEPEVSTARLRDVGESPHAASALLAVASDERSAVDDAVAFLEGELGDGHAMASKDILAAARKAGVSERTLRRASERVGVLKERVGFGGDGCWTWRIDGQTQPTPPIPHFLAINDDDLATNGGPPKDDQHDGTLGTYGEDGQQ